MLKVNKGITPVVALEERLEIVRSISFVDKAVVETRLTRSTWKRLQFDVLFKGDAGRALRRVSASIAIRSCGWSRVVEPPRMPATSSTVLARRASRHQPIGDASCAMLSATAAANRELSLVLAIRDA